MAEPVPASFATSGGRAGVSHRGDKQPACRPYAHGEVSAAMGTAFCQRTPVHQRRAATEAPIGLKTWPTLSKNQTSRELSRRDASSDENDFGGTTPQPFSPASPVTNSSPTDALRLVGSRTSDPNLKVSGDCRRSVSALFLLMRKDYRRVEEALSGKKGEGVSGIGYQVSGVRCQGIRDCRAKTYERKSEDRAQGIKGFGGPVSG
jgi:hypothetical protein